MLVYTKKTNFIGCFMDLGLVAIDDGTPVIANPIYREVIARHLTYGQQLVILLKLFEKKDWSRF